MLRSYIGVLETYLGTSSVNMKKFFGLRGQSLNWAIGLIAGCDFLLFGYGEFNITPHPCLMKSSR